jgi:hypothetical protein
MGWIDVAIPGVIGLLLAVRPGSFIKPSGDADRDAARARKFRIGGLVLLAVAGLYLLIKLASA